MHQSLEGREGAVPHKTSPRGRGKHDELSRANLQLKFCASVMMKASGSSGDPLAHYTSISCFSLEERVYCEG